MATPYAFVTLVTSDSYLPGALTQVAALRELHQSPLAPPEAPFQTVCVVTPETVDVSSIKLLRKAFDLVVGVEVIEQLDDRGLHLLGRPDLYTVLTKLHIFRLTQYSKIIFLDADVLPIRPLSHLFTLPHEFSAVPDVGWPDIFNSGVLVFSPGEDKFNELNELLKTKGTWDGGDQGLLNEWRGSDWHRLSFTYNTTPTAAYTYAPAYERFGSQISALHFIGPNKPWNSIPFRDPGIKFATTPTVPSGSQQAYDYPSLVDRWFNVYDRNYRTYNPSQPPEFELQRYPSVWDSPGTGGETSQQMGGGGGGGGARLEELRRAAVEGSGSLSVTRPPERAREGEYRSLPLEGRIDLMRPEKNPEPEQVVEPPQSQMDDHQLQQVPQTPPHATSEPQHDTGYSGFSPYHVTHSGFANTPVGSPIRDSEYFVPYTPPSVGSGAPSSVAHQAVTFTPPWQNLSVTSPHWSGQSQVGEPPQQPIGASSFSTPAPAEPVSDQRAPPPSHSTEHSPSQSHGPVEVAPSTPRKVWENVSFTPPHRLREPTGEMQFSMQYTPPQQDTRTPPRRDAKPHEPVRELQPSNVQHSAPRHVTQGSPQHVAPQSPPIQRVAHSPTQPSQSPSRQRHRYQQVHQAAHSYHPHPGLAQAVATVLSPLQHTPQRDTPPPTERRVQFQRSSQGSQQREAPHQRQHVRSRDHRSPVTSPIIARREQVPVLSPPQRGQTHQRQPEQRRVKSPSPPLISWNPAVEPPPNNPPTPSAFPEDTYFPNVWDQSPSKDHDAAHQAFLIRPSSPSVPIEEVFFHPPPPPEIPEELIREGRYTNVLGSSPPADQHGGSPPAHVPNRAKVKSVFPWEDRPRHAPRRVFPSTDSPPPGAKFIEEEAPSSPINLASLSPRQGLHIQTTLPPAGFPPHLNFANAWDTVPSIQRYASKLVKPNPLFMHLPPPQPLDGWRRLDKQRERDWQERQDASSMDGDDEDEGDSDEEGADPNTKGKGQYRPRRPSGSGSPSVRMKKEYRSRGVQTEVPEMVSQGVQVTILQEPAPRSRLRSDSGSGVKVSRSFSTGTRRDWPSTSSTSSNLLPSVVLRDLRGEQAEQMAGAPRSSLPFPTLISPTGLRSPAMLGSPRTYSPPKVPTPPKVPSPPRVSSPKITPTRPTGILRRASTSSTVVPSPKVVGTPKPGMSSRAMSTTTPPRAESPVLQRSATGSPKVLPKLSSPFTSQMQMTRSTSTETAATISPATSYSSLATPENTPIVPGRKSGRVWDPSRGVDVFKRGSEEVLARFLRMGSFEEDEAKRHAV